MALAEDFQKLTDLLQMTSMVNSMYSAIIGGGAQDVIKNPNFPNAFKAEIIKSYEDNNARVRKVTTY